jgi:exodeoxyribonuclease VII large subunit
MTDGRVVLTVSELGERLRQVVEEKFPAVWVEGEISNFKRYPSGHAYFTLKDANAQLRAILFRARGRRLRFEPGDGHHVLAFGSLEVYAQRGDYSLVVELLEPRGVGALQVAFEQLKARLAEEGLFNAARKRSLPRFPHKIGIVTSPTGAAIRDMLRVIGRRFAGLHIVIAPASVQGDGAAEDIVHGIEALNGLGDVDVIIVGRGGGSLEDLWAFNEEIVARALVASKAPVISAVGHEADFTIADFVADLRAPTPSAAAELVVKEKQAVVDGVADLGDRLRRAVHGRLERQRDRLEALARRRVLTDPARPLRDLERKVDDARARLVRAATAAMGRARHRTDLTTARLRAASPFTRLATGRHRLERLEAVMRGGIGRRLTASQHRLSATVGRLGSLSPLGVLARGYSLTRTAEGHVVKSHREVAAGDAVHVLLGEGSLNCRVERTKERDDRPQV